MPSTTPLRLPAEAQPANSSDLAFDARYDALVAELQRTRAQSATLRQERQLARQQHEHTQAQTEQLFAQSKLLTLEVGELHHKVKVKQDVITALLPYYPHPIPAKLQYAIDL